MDAIVQVTHRQPRQFRRIDLQVNLTDEELRKRYRFSSVSVDRLVGLIGHKLRRPTNRNRPLTPKEQVLVALRYYATGNFLQVIGDTFGIDIATVSRVVTRVTDALQDLQHDFIKFPTTEDERRTARNGFFKMRGFPCIIGLVDGTHVQVKTPGADTEPFYVNRKHRHTINVQATCDHEGKITSINACWPGGSHDSHVFRSSALCRHMEAHHQDPDNGLLLGDSGYACRPFLLTPYAHPASAQEERFNRAHMSTRNLIERVFGVWKRKFHVLHSEIRMKADKCSRVIVACAVLYNLSILWKEPNEDGVADPDQPDTDVFQGPMDGRGVRNRIATNYF